MTFQHAYDVLLDRWQVPIDQLDIAGTHVNACGPADAPPVVLLAGHGATSAVWFSVAPRLAEHYRVYAPDLPGDAGLSTATPPRTVDDLMAWLSGVLDGLDRPTLVGHSYGSWTALTYAIRNPARIGKLALIDPTDCFVGLKRSYVLRALPVLLRPSPATNQSFLRWETQGLPVDPDWLHLSDLGTLEHKTRPVRPKRPTAAELEGLKPDTLVFVADRSKSHDTAELARRALAAGATVVHLEKATHHSLPAAHGEELSEELLKFLVEG